MSNSAEEQQTRRQYLLQPKAWNPKHPGLEAVGLTTAKAQFQPSPQRLAGWEQLCKSPPGCSKSRDWQLQSLPGLGVAGNRCFVPISSPSPPARAPNPNPIWFTLVLFGSNCLTSCYRLWAPQPLPPYLWEQTPPSLLPSACNKALVGRRIPRGEGPQQPCGPPLDPSHEHDGSCHCPPMCLLPVILRCPGSDNAHPHPSRSGPDI